MGLLKYILPFLSWSAFAQIGEQQMFDALIAYTPPVASGGSGTSNGPPGFDGIVTNYTDSGTSIKVTIPTKTSSNRMDLAFVYGYDIVPQFCLVTNSTGQTGELRNALNTSLTERGAVFVFTNPPITSHDIGAYVIAVAGQLTIQVMTLSNTSSGFGNAYTNYRASNAIISNIVVSATNELICGFDGGDKSSSSIPTRSFSTGIVERNYTDAGTGSQGSSVYTQIGSTSATNSISYSAFVGAHSYVLLCIKGF